MTRTRITIVALSLLAGLGGAAAWVRLNPRSSVHAQDGCSVQSLNGSYVYAHTGFFFTSDGANIFAAAGTVSADGAGNMSGSDSTSVNGQITRNRTYTGAYTVNQACNGSVTFRDAKDQAFATMRFFISNGGNDIQFIQTDAGTAITGTAKRQFPPN